MAQSPISYPKSNPTYSSNAWGQLPQSARQDIIYKILDACLRSAEKTNEKASQAINWHFRLVSSGHFLYASYLALSFILVIVAFIYDFTSKYIDLDPQIVTFLTVALGFFIKLASDIIQKTKRTSQKLGLNSAKTQSVAASIIDEIEILKIDKTYSYSTYKSSEILRHKAYSNYLDSIVLIVSSRD